MRHTVVVSDIHLCDAVPGDGLWMRYRQTRYFPDERLAAMLSRVLSDVGPGDSLDVVFNGDIFDFDLPPVIDGEPRAEAPVRTALHAAARLARILDDHGVFVTAVARIVRAGHRAVFVSGNHDAQLSFPAVRHVLADRIAAAARALGCTADLTDRVLFRAWFHRTADGIHVEHGNQYDAFCSFRDPTAPADPGHDGAAIPPTVGSLTVQHLIGRMGYFNPNVDSTFILSLPDYLRHWKQYYSRSSRQLAAPWILGSLRIAFDLVHHRDRIDGARIVAAIEATAADTGCDPAAIAAHLALFAPSSLATTLRILWLDRVAILACGVAAAVAGAALLPRTAIGLALGAVSSAAFAVADNDHELPNVYARVEKCARAIARLHGARAIVLGHTHLPGERWEDGVFYGNCGTWAPAFRDPECTQPVDDAGDPFIWLQSRGEALTGGLCRSRDGRISGAFESPAPARVSRLPLPPSAYAARDVADAMGEVLPVLQVA